MTEIPPVSRSQGTINNPNRQRTPEEQVLRAQELLPVDKAELSEIARLTLELENAENELRLLPKSEFWAKQVLLLKGELNELTHKESTHGI